jgi:hypothetical protein
VSPRQSLAYANESRRLARELELAAAPTDDRFAYAIPAIRTGNCELCGTRILGDDAKIGRCPAHVNGIDPALKFAAIPARYRWARLEQPIVPPGWTLRVPLIPEHHRRKALAWAMGEHDGPRDALRVSCVQDEGSVTGAGKTSLVAAVALFMSERTGHPITWVHASELRTRQATRFAGCYVGSCASWMVSGKNSEGRRM